MIVVALAMAGRRTREEKKIAELRRKLQQSQIKQVSESIPAEAEKRPIAEQYEDQAPGLADALVKADLTKTVVVTILALVLQLALAMYLNKGGWQKVLGFLLRGGD